MSQVSRAAAFVFQHRKCEAQKESACLQVKDNCNVFGTRKAEVLNSLIMKITANENDTNDILQTFR